MADDANDTPRKSTRRTMAPAARDPRGAEDSAGGYSWLKDINDRDLDELTEAIRDERRRRVRVPVAPSFGMSEGEREELERTGRTVSPFTGELRGDWSGVHGGNRTAEDAGA